MEIALISFDGLDPRVIYNNEGDLPNIHSFMEDCIHGKWRTPGHTIPSYITTLTGVQCNTSHFRWDDKPGGFARHRQLERDYLWELTDSSMTLLNMPVLYPPEDIDDCMVCGMLTPDDVADTNLARPEKAQEILNEGDYIHEVRADKVFEELGAEGMFNLLSESMSLRTFAAERLIEEFSSDLFYGVWTAPDRWFHRHHTDGVDYYKMYKRVDAEIEPILKTIPDNIPVIMFSDHGFAHFSEDEPADTGHMYEGWYSIRHPDLPSYRDDSANIKDLFPTVLNYLGGDVPSIAKGRILFHREDQDAEVEKKLKDLGYL